jgi:hypothetical protein
MNITEKDIEIVKAELATKRTEYEKLKFSELEERLKWIKDFFNSYVVELEKRYMNSDELKEWKFLPDELRIHFYLYFPEHGLNMANYSQELAYELCKKRKKNKRRLRIWYSGLKHLPMSRQKRK